MKYKSIFNLCLLTILLPVVLVSCDDWTEMEIHDSQVNGFKEQNPQEYAAYTQKLHAYKASKHAVVYARLDNAPEVSTSEKDFLRALPDSIDIVTMRNAGRLSEYDREDMKLVRADYGTKVLYYIDCTDKDKLNVSIAAAVEAVRAGTFDGITLGSEASAVDAAVVKSFVDALGQTTCLLVFEGTPSLLPEAYRSLFNYFVLDISDASDEYDIETSVLYATGYGKVAPERLLLAVTPDGTLTDYNGVTRNAIGGAAYSALNMETPLGGIAIYNISADYYDTDIIYKQTRGGIQFLNPASAH
ncbi:glycoside hydrolase family 18 [Bacteroides congonensis]|mgnify:CR=1 FL=1